MIWPGCVVVLVNSPLSGHAAILSIGGGTIAAGLKLSQAKGSQCVGAEDVLSDQGYHNLTIGIRTSVWPVQVTFRLKRNQNFFSCHSERLLS